MMADSLAPGQAFGMELTKVVLDTRLAEDLRGANLLARDISRGT